jgi:hypothetical protein
MSPVALQDFLKRETYPARARKTNNDFSVFHLLAEPLHQIHYTGHYTKYIILATTPNTLYWPLHQIHYTGPQSNECVQQLALIISSVLLAEVNMCSWHHGRIYKFVRTSVRNCNTFLAKVAVPDVGGRVLWRSWPVTLLLLILLL